MSKQENGNHLILNNLIIVWPSLFTPRAYKDGKIEGKLQYQCMLFGKNDDAQLEKLNNYIAQVAQEGLAKDTAIKNKKDAKWISPIKDGHEWALDREVLELEDTWYIRPKTGEEYPPKIVDQRKKRIVNEDAIRAGAIVNAQIVAKYYHVPLTGPGVTLYLNAIQLVKAVKPENEIMPTSLPFEEIEELDDDMDLNDNLTLDDDDDFLG